MFISCVCCTDNSSVQRELVVLVCMSCQDSDAQELLGRPKMENWVLSATVVYTGVTLLVEFIFIGQQVTKG